jgi:hypothetical protein
MSSHQIHDTDHEGEGNKAECCQHRRPDSVAIARGPRPSTGKAREKHRTDNGLPDG